MSYLLIIGVTLVLLIGFYLLVSYETARGVRLFADSRTRLDRGIDRILFIVEHVDLPAFIRDEVRHLVERFVHAVVTISLQLVRAVERLLARLVRHFRTREANMITPRENARAFVKTLSDFKGSLRAPEVPEIQ